jgi:hypothetical protein
MTIQPTLLARDRTKTVLADLIEAALELRKHMGERVAVTLLKNASASFSTVARVLRDPSRRRARR